MFSFARSVDLRRYIPSLGIYISSTSIPGSKMSGAPNTLEYSQSLEKYALTEEEYYKQNPQYQVVCTGAVIFNGEGKMLLVQRAKEEKAFPNLWVCREFCALSVLDLLTEFDRKYQAARLTIPTNLSFMQSQERSKKRLGSTFRGLCEK